MVTGLGGLAVISWPLFLMAVVTGCAVAGLTRYVSLGSMCGAAVAMLASIVACIAGAIPLVVTGYILITGGLVIASHADNIERLRAGTERRLWGDGRASSP